MKSVPGLWEKIGDSKIPIVSFGDAMKWWPVIFVAAVSTSFFTRGGAAKFST
jgi:hypothetical protein